MEGDMAGSTQIGGYCPRGWLHSPMHAHFGSDQRYDSMLSAAQKKVQISQLNDFCSANDMETKMQIAEKMQEENARQERLRTARETCLPCQGTWPNCMCGGNIQTGNQAIKKLQVTREKDEADGVDQTLPRNDTVQSNMNYGKPSLSAGAQCVRAVECASGFCSGGFCCSKESNGCSKHGTCNSGGGCDCDQGWYGARCDSDTNMTANGVTKEAENKLEKSGINVTELEDAVRRGDAASIMKSVKSSDSEENGADLDEGVAGSKKSSNFHSASHEDYKDANKEYMGAVDKLGDELDNKKQTSAEAAALAADAKQKLARQEKILVQKKSDLAQVLRQIDATTDDVAKAKLTNDADAIKQEIDKLEASTTAMSGSVKDKLKVSSDSAQKVADDMARKAEQAKEMAKMAKQKENVEDMNKANKNLQETEGSTGTAAAVRQ